MWSLYSGWMVEAQQITATLSPPGSSGERERNVFLIHGKEPRAVCFPRDAAERSLKTSSCGCTQEISLDSSCQGTLMPKNTDATWDNSPLETYWLYPWHLHSQLGFIFKQKHLFTKHKPQIICSLVFSGLLFPWQSWSLPAFSEWSFSLTSPPHTSVCSSTLSVLFFHIFHFFWLPLLLKKLWWGVERGDVEVEVRHRGVMERNGTKVPHSPQPGVPQHGPNFSNFHLFLLPLWYIFKEIPNPPKSRLYLPKCWSIKQSTPTGNPLYKLF